MRIGILTCHSSLNYGANLQVYATVKALESSGHEVFVFDNRESEQSPVRAFIEKNCALTGLCLSDDDYRAETLRLKLDAILVGSDAVLWFLPGKEAGYGAYPNPFWLRWARDLPVRKALIAASCMGIMYPRLGGPLRKALAEDLKAFDYISVRDRWTFRFMKWAGVKLSHLVFDPTSSLPGLFDPSGAQLPYELESGNYVLFTFSYPEQATEWLESVSREAHERGLLTVHIPHPDRMYEVGNVDHSICEVLDPLDWLTVLANSAGYVGERFHPIVLSAFYRIPFLASDYYSRSGIHALLNARSKTLDFCRRIGAEKQTVPYDSFFRKVSAQGMFERLARQREFDDAACRVQYKKALAAAIGE